MRRRPVEGWEPEHHLRIQAYERLQEQRAGQRTRRLPQGAGPREARRLGLSTSTIQRDQRRGSPPSPHRKRLCLDEHAIRVLISMHMAIKTAWDLLVGSGWTGNLDRPPSYPTFWRAVQRDISRAEWLAWTIGEAAARGAELKLVVERRGVPGLYFDCKQISVWVWDRRLPEPVLRQPWVISPRWTTGVIARPETSLDTPSRYLVMRAYRNALFPDAEWSPAHGAPNFIGHDRGTEFLAEIGMKVHCELLIPEHISDGYHPQQNGTSETVHAIYEGDHCVRQPTYAHGPAKLDRTPILPDLDLAPDFEDWRHDFADVGGYVWQLNHRPLNKGPSPIERWLALKEAPEPIPETKLRWLGRQAYETLVTPRGVQQDSATYTDGELGKRIGHRVIIMVDDRQIDADVFGAEHGEFICTAVNPKHQSLEQQLGVVTSRRGDRAQRQRRHKDALRDIEAQMRARPARPPKGPELDAQDADLLARFRAKPRSNHNRPLP
jgi:hypothetical protein